MISLKILTNKIKGKLKEKRYFASDYIKLFMQIY